MRRNFMIVTTSALVVLAACGDGRDVDSLGPPPEASPTGNAPPAATSPTPATGATGTTITGGSGPLPTTSAGHVSVGNASISVSGALQTTQPALPLTGATIYAPPPGTFLLAWATAAAGFALGERPSSAPGRRRMRSISPSPSTRRLVPRRSRWTTAGAK
ncbi:MAG: hypothetical protein ABI595_12675 [Actinomycetota bacterium]